MTGNCQIQPDRFHPHRWWREIAETRATIVHYLGIIAPLLLGQPPGEDERRHGVRFGIGAGIEPQLHAPFEERFGFPLIELWGMTEMVRVLADNFAPRQVGTRAFGRAVPGVDVRVVDDARPRRAGRRARRDAGAPLGGNAAARLLLGLSRRRGGDGGGLAGRLVPHRRRGLRAAPDGMLHFVDRKKNIIRRSGENIAAAEVEAVLLTHPDVAAGGGDGGQGRAARGGGAGLRGAEAADCRPARRPRRCFGTATSGSPTTRRRAGSTSSTACRPRARRRSRSTPSIAAGTDPRSIAGIVDLRARKKRS